MTNDEKAMVYQTNSDQAKQIQRSGFSLKNKTKQNGKPQGLILTVVIHTDGSVTEGQSGWGFTVKQGATTINDYCII